MSILAASRLAWLALLSLPSYAQGADRYWTYTYRGVTVTATDAPERARHIAHDLHRLDLALARLLGTEPADWRPPVQVYLLSHSTTQLLLGEARFSEIRYQTSSFGTTIMLESGDASFGNPLFGAYFGYAGSLLNSGYSFRFPLWFIQGLSEVLGASVIDTKKVSLGGFVKGRVQSLYNNRWIPLKTLLRLHGKDSEFEERDFKAIYDAECWFLVHQIMIEGRYRTNFNHYFSLLDRDEEEANAFAESFSGSYDDLDKWLRGALSAGKLAIIQFEVTDDSDPEQPRSLTGSEANGRLARLAVQMNFPADSTMKFADAALAEDDKNVDALIAIAQTQLRQKTFAAAEQTAQRLCEVPTLTQSAAAECGHIDAALTHDARTKNTEATDWRHHAARAKTEFAAAVAQDPEDLRSWVGLSDLITTTRDSDAAKALLPQLKHLWAQHSTNEALARCASRLSATAADYDSALKFAAVWQKHALTQSSRDAADAYAGRLKAYVDRRALTDSVAPTPGTQPAKPADPLASPLDSTP